MRTLIAPLMILGLACVPAMAQQEWVDVPLTEHTFREHETPFRHDTIEIPISAFSSLEYEIYISEGDVIVYTWEADVEDAELLRSEFHGHTEPEPGEVMEVMYYRVASGDKESGSLVAPFTGGHGWYLVNESDQDIVVRLELAGFYERVDQ